MFERRIEELMGKSIGELDEALAAAKRMRDAAELEIAAITAVVDSLQAFQDHGHRSVNGYLRQQLNCPASVARKIKQRARLCNHHPAVGRSLGESRIGTAQVDLLAAAQQHPVAGQRFTDFAPLLLEHAEQLDYPDFALAVRHFTTHADPDGSFDDQKFREEHRTASVDDSFGSVNVHASGGDPVRAAEMAAVFRRAVEAEFAKDCETRRSLHGEEALAHPLARTADQRRFDAIYEIFIASVTAPADGKRPEPLVNIAIDPVTGLEVLARHGLLDVDVDTIGAMPGDAAGCRSAQLADPSTRRCATSTGTPVHPDVALAAMVRGSIRSVLVDAHDVVINLVGRNGSSPARHAKRPSCSPSVVVTAAATSPQRSAMSTMSPSGRPTAAPPTRTMRSRSAAATTAGNIDNDCAGGATIVAESISSDPTAPSSNPWALATRSGPLPMTGPPTCGRPPAPPPGPSG